MGEPFTTLKRNPMINPLSLMRVIRTIISTLKLFKKIELCQINLKKNNLHIYITRINLESIKRVRTKAFLLEIVKDMAPK